jgi:D-alanyl-D-alanine carboxypeptidase
MKNKKKETPKAIKILRIIMPLVGLATALIIPPLDLIPPLLAPLPETIEDQLDEAIEKGLDGMILYVNQGGQNPSFYSAGLKNKISGEPANAQDYFKIGSIHKLYIASAITKLVSAGQLSLDESLTNLLPRLAGRITNASEINVRMLVQHRSGIPNFTDQGNFDWFSPSIPREDALALVFDLPADFEPDTSYAYSNTNYLLLGFILDEVLGYSHHQFVDDQILAPLGLSNTFFSIEEVEFDAVMSGYWYEHDDDFRSLDGSMIATAEDVGVFVRALNDGSLFTNEEQDIYSSIYQYGHDGWVPGYFSKAHYHEDIDAVLVLFVSTTGGETWGVADVIGGKATALSQIYYDRILQILRNQS